jgi:hypothetical protein
MFLVPTTGMEATVLLSVSMRMLNFFLLKQNWMKVLADPSQLKIFLLKTLLQFCRWFFPRKKTFYNLCPSTGTVSTNVFISYGTLPVL